MAYFSFHPNVADLGNHALYAKGFSTIKLGNLNQITMRLRQQLNTPIVWTYGIRKEYNFQRSNFCVLDVDDGPALEHAVDSLREFEHIIGTTKSHRKDKGGKIRDRYRVFLVTDGEITSARMYKHMNELIAKQYGGDLQACGAHMAFMPLRDIISVRESGVKLPLIEPPPMVKAREKWTSNAIYSGNRRMPRYLQHYLDTMPAEGERNLMCFRAASGLSRVGFSEDEIVGLILDSRIPLNTSESVIREVRSAVRNAVRRN